MTSLGEKKSWNMRWTCFSGSWLLCSFVQETWLHFSQHVSGSSAKALSYAFLHVEFYHFEELFWLFIFFHGLCTSLKGFQCHCSLKKTHIPLWLQSSIFLYLFLCNLFFFSALFWLKVKQKLPVQTCWVNLLGKGDAVAVEGVILSRRLQFKCVL